MSKVSAGFRLIAGISSLAVSSVASQKRVEVVDLYPHLGKATPQVRECVDAFYSQYSMSVPEDWIVLQRAREDYVAARKLNPIHLNTWIGLADYLNAREGIDLTRGDAPQYYASSLVLYYVLNEWMPQHGFDQETCYKKYAAGVADYIGFSCHRMPPYPARSSHGQVLQFFRNEIPYLKPSIQDKPAPAEYLTPGQVVWTEEQRKLEEERRKKVADILVEGYGQVQKEIQRREIRREAFKAYGITIGLPILISIICSILSM